MSWVLPVLIGAGVAWYILDTYFYSHKAIIKRLWKGIFENTSKIVELEKTAGKNILFTPIAYLEWRTELSGKLINALLDYYYSKQEGEEDEEENEYAVGNRWKPK